MTRRIKCCWVARESKNGWSLSFSYLKRQRSVGVTFNENIQSFVQRLIGMVMRWLFIIINKEYHIIIRQLNRNRSNYVWAK